MKLQVNIIPIIAKSDTINKPELLNFKKRIMSELSSNGIQVWNLIVSNGGKVNLH